MDKQFSMFASSKRSSPSTFKKPQARSSTFSMARSGHTMPAPQANARNLPVPRNLPLGRRFTERGQGTTVRKGGCKSCGGAR